ncbi:LysR family transcriptional regulator [Roseibium sp. RKSG952]|uniref:LysR family transcriptional regulator n=1 Tax=Roseibium sp. RKSG952 TaxID=2529384 RepID=UPI0012BBDCFC|nr:LysR family transcriptional regulator [Roseibium sp. RKSG952]MTH94824.1 LysR family transcriptional regulator [Roseibium sp. RKSG952]
MLDSRWLKTFVVLCETGHFTKTADILGMTQPGVSQHLRKLEAAVGQPLVRQQGKSFSLTSAGEQVFALGQKRRDEDRQLLEGISEDRSDIGRVSIGCSGSFAMLLLPELLSAMQASPQLVIHQEAAPQSNILNGVLEGRLDLGVIGHNPGHPRLAAEYLGTEELCLLLPSSMACSNPDLETLEGLGFIAHPDGYAYADLVFSANFPSDFQGSDRLRARAFVNQIGQIPAPVAAGVGYTILPRNGFLAFPGRDQVKVADMRERRFLDLWLVCRRGRHMPARIKHLANMIRLIATVLEHRRLERTGRAG